MTKISLEAIQSHTIQMIEKPINPLINRLAFEVCYLFLTSERCFEEDMSYGERDRSYRAISTGKKHVQGDYVNVGNFLDQPIEGYRATYVPGCGFAPQTISGEIDEDIFRIATSVILDTMGISDPDQISLIQSEIFEENEFIDWLFDEVLIDVMKHFSEMPFSVVLDLQLDMAKDEYDKEIKLAEERKQARNLKLSELRVIAGEGLIQLIERTLGRRRYEKPDKDELYNCLNDLSSVNTKPRVRAALVFANLNVSNSLKECLARDWLEKL